MLAVCKAQSMRVFVILIALGLVACGGGGGGGGSETTASAKFTLPGEVEGGSAQAVALATDGTGDLYVGGEFISGSGTTSTSSHLVRFNSDGTVDSNFDVGTGFDSMVRSIAPANDGSGDIYVGGDFTSYDGATSAYIIRLNSDGTVDTGFDVGTGFNNSVYTIAPALDNSGDVYVGGDFTSYDGTTINYTIRLNNDGTMDADFAVPSVFINNRVVTIAPATDGSGNVYVGGLFTGASSLGSTGLIRLTNTATLSKGYNFSDPVHSVVPATDGSGDIYVGGEFYHYNSEVIYCNNIIRLNSDRTVDSVFDVSLGGFTGTVVNSIVPTTDGSGDIYVGGRFVSYNKTASNNIIRLNSDGTVDTDFAVGPAGFDSRVNSIALATDGSGDIYVGGDFTNYQGFTAQKIISLKSDGSIN